MKQVIIVLFSTMLGIYLFSSVLVGDTSIRSNASKVFEVQISNMKNVP